MMPATRDGEPVGGGDPRAGTAPAPAGPAADGDATPSASAPFGEPRYAAAPTAGGGHRGDVGSGTAAATAQRHPRRANGSRPAAAIDSVGAPSNRMQRVAQT